MIENWKSQENTLIYVCLIAPFLPKLGYYPSSVLICAILLLWGGLKKIKLNSPSVFSLTDLGGFLLFGAVFYSFFRVTYATTMLPSNHQYNIYILCFSVLFYLKQNSSFVKNKHIVSLVSFLLLALLFIYISYLSFFFSYSQLTFRLTYSEGFGSISQIAMYVCYYLVLIALSIEKQKYLTGISLLLSVCIGIMLKSKLVFLVGFLVVLHLLLNTQNRANKIKVLFALLCASVIGLLMYVPDSFNGRLNNFIINIFNIDWTNLGGIGLGNYERFINEVFFYEKAFNNIGVIDKIAFNDYIQIFVELGVLGVLGLCLLSIALLKSRSPFLALAIILVSGIMFPFQYFESMLLWVVSFVMISKNDDIVVFNIRNVSYVRSLFIKIMAIFSLGFTIYSMGIQYKWYTTNRDIKKTTESQVTEYSKLKTYFSDTDKYYFNYAKISTDKKEALKAFEDAVEMNKSYKNIIHLADAYYDEKKVELAISYYKKAMLLRPENLYPMYKMIFCFYQKEDYAKLYLFYQKTGKYKDSKNAKVHQMLRDIEKIIDSLELNE